MYIRNLDEVKIPSLPKLTNGFVVVQEPAWNTLIEYVQKQTDTINAIIELLKSSTDLNNKNNKRLQDEIETIAKEVSDIASALEGAYEDA